MKGKYDVVIETKSFVYSFTLMNKITIIKGNSAIGKSTLYNLICEYNRGTADLRSNVEGMLYGLVAMEYELILSSMSNKIVFIDEDYPRLSSSDFAGVVKNSDNYFVIISRDYFISGLTYHIDSIKKLQSSVVGEVCYYSLVNVFGDIPVMCKPDVFITEGNGLDRRICESLLECRVESACGKDKVISKVEEFQDKVVCVLVDESAFGSRISAIMLYNKFYNNMYLLAPESFEYMLMHRDDLYNEVKDKLERPYDFCDVSKYSTWELYFTSLLKSIGMKLYNCGYNKAKNTKTINVSNSRDVVRSF